MPFVQESKPKLNPVKWWQERKCHWLDSCLLRMLQCVHRKSPVHTGSPLSTVNCPVLLELEEKCSPTSADLSEKRPSSHPHCPLSHTVDGAPSTPGVQGKVTGGGGRSMYKLQARGGLGCYKQNLQGTLQWECARPNVDNRLRSQASRCNKNSTRDWTADN